MPQRYTAADSDTHLVEGCRLQHPLAQKYLYERYFGRLLSMAYRYASDKQEAIGIVNQSFLKIFQAINRYETIHNLLSWMRTIVFRTALNHVRDKVTFDDIDDVKHAHLQNTPLSNAALAAFDMDYILAALQKLPDTNRAVFSLFEIDGYSHAEIAETLGISVGTSKWYLSDAKARLRKILQNDKEKNTLIV
jgi:RNA polymerase sigma factor (sigma-70 family)